MRSSVGSAHSVSHARTNSQMVEKRKKKGKSSKLGGDDWLTSHIINKYRKRFAGKLPVLVHSTTSLKCSYEMSGMWKKVFNKKKKGRDSRST